MSTDPGDGAERPQVLRATREQRGADDIEIINRNAERLNVEAADVLGYQEWLRGTASSTRRRSSARSLLTGC